MVIYFPRIVNKKWIKRNSINQRIGLEGSKIFSKAILESWNHGGDDKDIAFSDLLLSNGDIKSKRISQDIKLILFLLEQSMLYLTIIGDFIMIQLVKLYCPFITMETLK